MALPPKSEMMQHYAAGRLLKEIGTNYACLPDRDHDETVADMAELHNSGRIDMLALLVGSDPTHLECTRSWYPGGEFGEQAGNGPEHSHCQRFYCALLPHLNAPTAQVLAAAHALRTAAARNLGTYSVDKAFGDWCVAHGDQLDEVIALVGGGTPFTDAFMPTALATGISLDEGRYLDQALTFMEADGADVRLAALRALGRSAPQTVAAVDRILSALVSALNRNADDRIRACILTAALGVASRFPERSRASLLAVVQTVATRPGPETLIACADALACHAKSLADEAIEAVLQALRQADPTCELTLSLIDTAFIQLLSLGHEERAMALAEHLLVAHEDKLTLERFRSLHHVLVTGDKQRLGRTLVRLFLAGKLSLCEAAASLVRGSHDRPAVLDIDFAAMQPSHGQAMYLARKAIGYWFVHPVAAASFIVSLLRYAPDTTAGELRALLLDPLLLNYGGAAKAYLEQVAGDASDQAARHVAPVLAEHDQYLEDLRSAGKIPELHPSERQRRIEHEREHDRMATAMKQAQKGSIIRQLMRTSVLLYGSRSISHVDNLDGTRRRLDTKLGSITTTMEHPRVQAIDPVGLDFMIRVFRTEAPPR